MKLDFLKNFDFFAGVPDSLLKPLCNYLMQTYGISKNHVIAANEGNAVALAAGYHLATGKIPVVYLQNSGLGNIINPVASLMNDKVYGIPCLFIVGWRGEPGVHDEPQHVYQGEVTLKLLEDMDISSFVVDRDTTESELEAKIAEFNSQMENGKQTALVIKKGALEFDGKVSYSNSYSMTRERIIEIISESAGNDVIVSTTGKASRELFEIRENKGDIHGRDFLTVGSMGHSSSIALAVAEEKTDSRVWVIDGDGAVLMHMGAMAVIGARSPKNLVHVVINNGSHETVGGLPTVAEKIDLCKIAEGCGYPYVSSVDDEKSLREALDVAKEANALSFIEVKSSIGARADLGRPTTTAIENKNNFMSYLKEI